MSLNLRQIEVFRAVMSTGSISGASKVLHVSQPAVSRLLSYTETRVGFPLFERIKGRLYATPEAKRLFREVDHVYLGVQRVNEVAHSLAERRQGVLHVVSSPSIGHVLIPQAIAQLCQQFTDAKVTFNFLNYAPLRDRLLNHQADIGVISTPIDHPNLETKPLGESTVCCVCPADHPLTQKAMLSLADLADYPLISYDRETPYGRMVTQMYNEAGLPLKSTIEVGSPQSACALVQAGAGIALVDEFSLHNWPNGQLMARPVAGAPVMMANLAFLRFEPMSQLAQSFVQILRKLMAANGFSLKDDRQEGGWRH
ncbi:LysR substrate-binding domain-containing protein [uncultured Ferrovibrio sp.]|jgi:Transcriptional regulator|uniref:LysR substrate-binding domain-containing protein n=1 Tax=uncultured Ferrovibrio sp. TaxID=1576913 RepID=UPI00260A3B74|nr:LysR substrate-binding domain-containing protein [uncultured Ferrovibrio sp.]